MTDPIMLTHRCISGGGNAAIRPYQCHPHWQAAGVPTGSFDIGGLHHMGYTTVDAQVTTALSHAFNQIGNLLSTGRFDTLAFSYDPTTKFGGKIFHTAQPVRDYIYEQLVSVALDFGVIVLKSKFAGSGIDGDFSYMITRQPKTLFIFNDNEEEFYKHFNDLSNPFR